MINPNLKKIITESLIEHNFTIKATIIAALNLILPLIWPLIGVSVLMVIDLWSAYKANKKYKIPFHSKGLGKSISKWMNFLLGVVVTVIVDTIFLNYNFLPGMVFTSIFITISALRELRSISENFSGLGLIKVVKVVVKYVSTKKIDLYEIIEKEVKDNPKNINNGN